VKTIGIIGGTGALALAGAHAERGGADARPVMTAYGETSGALLRWDTARARIRFIARHGPDASIPPHLVNYRANVWALRQESPDFVVALNAVGGIAPWAAPATLVIPDQLIDYTWGRAHTYADGVLQPLRHVDFTAPFSAGVHARLVTAAEQQGLEFHPSGTCGVTQGPRLETSAEIDRLERDGCDIVGMTAMPEAALAREAGLEYAICAIVVNRAAGRAPDGPGIHAELQRYVGAGMEQVGRLLAVL
jgi:purine nucleoside phosphorylase